MLGFLVEGHICLYLCVNVSMYVYVCFYHYLCKCVFISMYVNVCVYMCVFASFYVCECVCVYMCVFVPLCEWMCVCVYMWVIVSLCVNVGVYMYVFIPLCVWMCVHVYVCMCVHICDRIWENPPYCPFDEILFSCIIENLYHRANLPPSLRPIARFALELERFVHDRDTSIENEKLRFEGVAMYAYGVSVYYAWTGNQLNGPGRSCLKWTLMSS